MATLNLQNIRLTYGDAAAVDGVSLQVHRGEIVGLLGPNGSGKSTTLAIAAGILAPHSGTVSVEGFCHKTHPEEFARHLGYVPQNHALYDELSARDNLTFFGRLYSLSGANLRRQIPRVLDAVGLADRAGDRVGTFSGGMKQRLNLAASLLHDPVLLLLDEPTAALDPVSRDALFARLTRLRDEGHAILITTHHLDEAERSCDRIAILERGRLVAAGKPRDLLQPSIAGKAVLFGQLRDPLPVFQERAVRQRLGARVELEVTGRRLRLAAETSEELGRSLAFLLAAGVVLESFRSPTGSLERVMRASPAITPEASCRVGSA